ncbi:AraC family transcriptional regulator [Aliifodinibius sp. S!AR15-10]|uniref:helix-turn-helix transcriptional regulator n=1 Tax=Aliifodinibius sp. S!AR15-10 TaxID=2950437 RepID=UPI00285CED5B|nr:AraC family transcriptional regulator [Aliifodinibius sp. S!AR15-10]MDR8391273.1 AraC family transcriptional regulator [Aliifodinibius sp. S!AR15-10]
MPELEVKGVLSRYRDELPEPDPEWPYEVSEAVKCIHENLYNPKLTIKWMKTHCHINGKSFSGRFKIYLYQYPKSYILHHRIEVSKKLLTQTSETVTQIALIIGFTSLSSFCNTFKAQFDLTPSQWRRSHQFEQI